MQLQYVDCSLILGLMSWRGLLCGVGTDLQQTAIGARDCRPGWRCSGRKVLLKWSLCSPVSKHWTWCRQSPEASAVVIFDWSKMRLHAAFWIILKVLTVQTGHPVMIHGYIVEKCIRMDHKHVEFFHRMLSPQLYSLLAPGIVFSTANNTPLYLVVIATLHDTAGTAVKHTQEQWRILKECCPSSSVFGFLSQQGDKFSFKTDWKK